MLHSRCIAWALNRSPQPALHSLYASLRISHESSSLFSLSVHPDLRLPACARTAMCECTRVFGPLTLLITMAFRWLYASHIDHLPCFCFYVHSFYIRSDIWLSCATFVLTFLSYTPLFQLLHIVIPYNQYAYFHPSFRLRTGSIRSRCLFRSG